MRDFFFPFQERAKNAEASIRELDRGLTLAGGTRWRSNMSRIRYRNGELRGGARRLQPHCAIASAGILAWDGLLRESAGASSAAFSRIASTSKSSPRSPATASAFTTLSWSAPSTVHDQVAMQGAVEPRRVPMFDLYLPPNNSLESQRKEVS